MRGTGAVVFFMLGVGLIYFAWNTGLFSKLFSFVLNPTVGAGTIGAP